MIKIIIPDIIHRSALLLACLLFLLPSFSHAEDGICARVKIEIRQEMTLERQAFEAHMRINNGFDNITLDGVSIDVHFSDEDGTGVIASSDPNDTQALFFIRLDSKEGIDDWERVGQHFRHIG